jgi:hypothetical protein
MGRGDEGEELPAACPDDDPAEQEQRRRRCRADAVAGDRLDGRGLERGHDVLLGTRDALDQ